ncbi:MAG TPA: DUF4402 domain-containing protein [Sphingomicrobium sp.]|nr:DUF4402 domain-containing protein [Sphingomicrobium sp.]
MKNIARLAALAAAATIVATPAAAQVSVSNGPVTATARITKPLTLTRLDDIDFGEIIVQGSDTVSIDYTNGNLSCGAPANLTCQGATKRAQYRVTGTNNQDVTVTMPDVTLSNGTDNLTLVLAGPGTVNLTNSGSVGETFYIGGSIAIDETVSEGTYTGQLAVTVEY